VLPLAYYFVVNENIYPSSDIYSIFASRLVLSPLPSSKICFPPSYLSNSPVASFVDPNALKLSASHSLRKALSTVQSLHAQQKAAPPKSAQTNALQEREGEMIQALQSTLKVLHAERTRVAEATKPQSVQGGRKSERDSASPTEIRSPKARRRKSKAM